MGRGPGGKAKGAPGGEDAAGFGGEGLGELFPVRFAAVDAQADDRRGGEGVKVSAGVVFRVVGEEMLNNPLRLTMPYGGELFGVSDFLGEKGVIAGLVFKIGRASCRERV